jgi:surface antigen
MPDRKAFYRRFRNRVGWRFQGCLGSKEEDVTMKFARLGAALALTAALGACTNMGNKEIIGTAAGAGVGGLIGSQIGHGSGQLAATAAGVFIGGLIGNQIGAYMDEQDKQRARQAEYDALERYPDGGQSRWENPNNGHYGYSVPERTYQDSSGQYCREYQTTVVIDNHPQSGHGTACREPDGTWRLVS